MFHALAAALAVSLLSPEPATRADAPSGWATLQDGGERRFFFPRGADRSTFVAIFPTQPLQGTLQDTLSRVWRATIGGERLVDAHQAQTASSDGAPSLLEIVATVDGANRGIYRIFVAKSYGTRVVCGEFRSDDPDKMKGVGDEALHVLQSMSVAAR